MIPTTVPSPARIAHLGDPCCLLHHGDPVVTPLGDIDLVVSVGPRWVNVIDSDGNHHPYLPADLVILAGAA